MLLQWFKTLVEDRDRICDMCPASLIVAHAWFGSLRVASSWVRLRVNSGALGARL